MCLRSGFLDLLVRVLINLCSKGSKVLFFLGMVFGSPGPALDTFFNYLTMVLAGITEFPL